MRKHIVPLAVSLAAGVALGVITPAVWHLGDAAAAPSHHVTPTVTVTAHPKQTISEDDPQWNCLTMGNHKCGPSYIPVSPAMGKALAEAGEGPREEDWSQCLTTYDDPNDATIVVCPDGTLVIS